ncbi:ecto-ADP-ribosyltransferase 3 isoform X2 [Perognathus longimembris pacificus]|uniref:ecto-ADP-ribosyltransferase 3 isoform X2 n=1 Tax=Perognathus longimembris pacificus TaxID=214514 RepID=UPI0020187229|nr:ecto-ADP-ribosyltransferase 3 isoform X2 [Perognathus longimembris pacificus]
MKMCRFEMVTKLLAALILMDIFQVKVEMLDMAGDAFDDEYLKCSNRMEMKYVPQLLEEEKASHQLFRAAWENARSKWEARKPRVSVPRSFKDNHGIALLLYISEAQEQTPFSHLFNKAVEEAGKSRKDYIYDFQFKAFHFYLTRALQLLRGRCAESYAPAVYASRPAAPAEPRQGHARLGRFTLARAAGPQATGDGRVGLTIHTCFGVAVEAFLDQSSGRMVLVPLNEVFQVSQEGNGKNLLLQSTNKTCSHYECSFLGGLKTEECVTNPDDIQPIYVYVPDATGRDPTAAPGLSAAEPFPLPGRKRVRPDGKPGERSQINIDNPTAAGPVPAPSPKSHPSASCGPALLPLLPLRAAVIVLILGAAALRELLAP